MKKNIENKKGNVAWFVPPLSKGSGGHRTIFQNASALINHEYNCDVYVCDYNRHTKEELKEIVNNYYGYFNGDVFPDWNKTNKEYDVCVATSYSSAPIVKRIKCEKKLYFIQDYEPYFFPIGSDYLIAENTYRFGFYGITIGKWLSYKINKEFALNTDFFHFCADLNIYKRIDSIKKENSICFIFQPDKPRRCDIIGLKALQIVKSIRPEITIYTYGSIKRNINNLDVKQLGIISAEQCNELYNRCKVGLCMSASNPSRIPFEMMASGLPVVELYRDNNLYDMPNESVLLADSSPEAIATALLKVFDDDLLQEKMSTNGIEYMKNYPIEKGFTEFIEAFNRFFYGSNTNYARIDKMYTKQKVCADIKKIEEKDSLPEISFEMPELEKPLVNRVLHYIKKIIKKLLIKK